jgi:hypothetical protein
MPLCSDSDAWQRRVFERALRPIPKSAPLIQKNPNAWFHLQKQIDVP